MNFRSCKTVLMAASIALNLVFAATYLTCKLHSPSQTCPPMAGSFIYLQLGLSPEQLRKFQSEQQEMQGQLGELSRRMETKQNELIDVMAKAPPPQATIDAKQSEIQSLQGAVEARIVQHLLRVSAWLSPEQRTRFFQIVKERMVMNCHACSAGMGQTTAGPGLDCR
jgi:hypothetical protein